MVALDQRPPLFDAIAEAKGITRDQVEYSDVTAAKRLLVENLAPHCSSMLFDPNFAVPAAIDLLPPRAGITAMTRFPFSMIVVVLDSSFNCGARREDAKMINRFAVFCPFPRVDPGILANWKDTYATAGVLN